MTAFFFPQRIWIALSRLDPCVEDVMTDKTQTTRYEEYLRRNIVIRPLDMIKQYDFVVLGIPYKKNRSARLQKKMQKIVREKTS